MQLWHRSCTARKESHPTLLLHEIFPLPQQAPSKNIQVYHAKERTISGSPKRQSEVPPKNQSSFSKKGPPLGSLPIKPDHEAVFRGWIEFLLTQLMSAACSPPQGFQEQIGLHRHILSDFMHSEALRHKIPGSEGHRFFSLLSAYVFLQKKKKNRQTYPGTFTWAPKALTLTQQGLIICRPSHRFAPCE